MSEQTTRFVCPYCPDKPFGNLQSMKEHSRVIHQETICQICHVDLGHPYSLIDHIQRYHGLDSPDWAGIGAGGVPRQSSQSSRTSAPRQLSPQQLPIEYTKVPAQQRDLILQDLLSRCHSTSRLHMQNYIMPVLNSAVAQGTRLPVNGVAINGRVESNNTPGGFAPRNPGNGHPNMAPPTGPRKRHALPPELFKPTPPSPSVGAHQKGKAVALDCEMVEITTCHSELAYLSAVDFLTGEVLINSFVKPTGPVLDWRTRTSGINAWNMGEAIRTGKVPRGWHAARDKLWEFIDDQTVLVGHALNHDLQVLGIFHDRIVDSSIVTAEAVFNTVQPDGRFPRLWSLQQLAKALLDRDIQTSDQGHYALEDAYAARDIVLCAIQTPETLTRWAHGARQIEQRKQEERERAIEARKKREEAAAAQVMHERYQAVVQNFGQFTSRNEAQLMAFMGPAPSFGPIGDSRIPIGGDPNPPRGPSNAFPQPSRFKPPPSQSKSPRQQPILSPSQLNLWSS